MLPGESLTDCGTYATRAFHGATLVGETYIYVQHSMSQPG